MCILRTRSLSFGSNPGVTQKLHHGGNGVVSDVESGEAHAVLRLKVDCVNHGAVEVKSACLVTVVVVGLFTAI